MTLTAFREAVAALLAGELDIEFVPGKLEGPVEGKDLGCSWPLRVEEGSPNSEGILEQSLLVAVRVFKAARSRQSTARSVDPAPLEELAEQIQLAVSKHQTGYGIWFQRVTEVEFDMDLQMVEAAVLGVQANASL